MANSIDVGDTDLLYYPSNLTNLDLNPGLIQFQYFDVKPDGTITPKQTIHLGMPDVVSSPSTVSWDNEKFGMAGKDVQAALAKMGGKEDSATLDAAAYTDATRQRMVQGAKYGIAATANQALGGTATADGLMGVDQGMIPNPYLTAVFRGVDFRTFSFQFKFSPLSIDDCDTIQQIYSVMRANALPDFDGGEAAPFLAYPYQCMIAYFWKGEQNQWLHNFKKSACTAIDIDFAGAGYFTAMRNGFPSQITISTRWTEMELVTRSDVLQGGY